MNKKNFNEVLKQREIEEAGKASDDGKMSLDSTERVKVLSPGQLVFKRFINNKLAIVGSAVLIFMFLFAFVMPLFYPYSQTEIFYKYDSSIVDYAMASERMEYTLMQVNPELELHYTVKNNLTAMISKMTQSGQTDVLLTDADGNMYNIEKINDNIYTLSATERKEVAYISSEKKYAEYSAISDEMVLESNVEEIEGLKEAVLDAIQKKKAEFSHAGIDFTIVSGKMRTYTINMLGGGISYVGNDFGEDFEKQVNDIAPQGSFEWEGKKYAVSVENDVTRVYDLSGQTVIGYLTNYVFDAYNNPAVITNEFKLNAIAATVSGDSFTADGVEYTVVEEEEERYIYAVSDATIPVAAFSNMVIRNYDGTDNLEFAFKEKVHEVVEEMQNSGKLESSFVWAIAQVNSEGEYTLDTEGNLIKEDVEVSIVNKNGSYVMSCPTVTYLIDIFARPSKTHWFGTDGDGMDVLARMMYGGRVSLIFCFVTIIIEMILGVIMGGIAGFFGGWVDNIIMRAVDVFYCIPSMPILIILGAVFDSLKMEPYTRVMWMMAVLGILGWASVARMVRGQILSLREQEFMVAAEAIGLRTKRRIFKHLVPNVMPQLIVTASSGLGGIIITESTLSFLGLGVKHPLATWGTMINSVSTAEAMVRYTYIWIPVGLLICLTVIAFNFVGDGLRDAFDPKMKR